MIDGKENSNKKHLIYWMSYLMDKEPADDDTSSKIIKEIEPSLSNHILKISNSLHLRDFHEMHLKSQFIRIFNDMNMQEIRNKLAAIGMFKVLKSLMEFNYRYDE